MAQCRVGKIRVRDRKRDIATAWQSVAGLCKARAQLIQVKQSKGIVLPSNARQGRSEAMFGKGIATQGLAGQSGGKAKRSVAQPAKAHHGDSRRCKSVVTQSNAGRWQGQSGAGTGTAKAWRGVDWRGPARARQCRAERWRCRTIRGVAKAEQCDVQRGENAARAQQSSAS